MFRDLGLAARQLVQRPLFTLTAVLTLALGMGVNVVAFTVVNGVLFRGPAAYAASSLFRLAMTPGGDEEGNASAPEYERIAGATEGVLTLAAEGRDRAAWQHDGVTEAAWALYVSPGYFSLLDAAPWRGRLEVRAGRGADPPVVAIGERFWRRSLREAPLDRLVLTLNGVDTVVAGIVPESFAGPAGLYSPDVWLPFDDPRLRPAERGAEAGAERWLFLFGRPTGAATAAEIRGRLEAAAAAMADDWPGTHAGRGIEFRPLGTLGGERATLMTAASVAMGIIGLVLLLACFNVANLLLARAVERERDMAVRVALGAGTARLIRLLVSEGLLVSLVAGAVALLLSFWTQALVGSFAIPIDVPQHIDLRPDGRVLVFVAMLVLAAGVLPGLWPALATARVDVLRVLGSQGGGASGARPSPARRWLVGLQVAGSTAFLAVAALFVQSYGHLAEADLGFDHDRLLVVEFDPAIAGDAQTSRYTDDVVAAVRAVPGVSGAVLATRAPFFIGFSRPTAVTTPEAVCSPIDACPSYPTVAVEPGYFDTLGIALAAGRDFSEHEAAGAEAIVNQSLAARLWPGGDVIGRTVALGPERRLATVVAVTAPARTRGLSRESPEVYLALGRSERAGGPLGLVVRTDAAPDALLRPLHDAVAGVDADVSRVSVNTMTRRMAVQLWPFRTVSWLFSICDLLALVLATTGLGAVVEHATSRRTREFGIRMSLGASRRDLIADVLRDSAGLLAPGAVAGALVAGLGAHLARAALVGVNVLNPGVYALVLALEAAIVVLASLAPALRAARTDPLVALRTE